MQITPDIAEILGAFIGDGWIEKRLTGLYIVGHKTEDKEHYDNFLAPKFSEIFCKVIPREFSYWRVYGISCYKKSIIRECLNLGFQSGSKAITVSIPNDLLNSNKEIIKGVLRGIFDTDGSFWCEKSYAKTSTLWKRTYHSHPEIKITSCSKLLVQQIKCLLDELGIYSNIVQSAKKGFVCGRSINDCYGLRVRRLVDIKKWFDIIGSHNPKHMSKYLIWRKFGFVPTRTTLKQRHEILAGNLDPKVFYKDI